MSAEQRPRAAHPGASRKGHTTILRAESRPAPGEWPPCPYTDELLTRLRWERARRELTLGAIAGDLEEQPSRASIYACARRWSHDINQLADTIASALNSTETDA